MAASGPGPFPLQTNLRRLSPNLTRIAPVLLGGLVFVINDEFLENILELLSRPEGQVIAGLLGAVIVFLLADLYIKQIWFNESGIGVRRVFGGESTWYSFDELKDGRFSMKRPTKRSPLRGSKPSGPLILHFHTGTVRIWQELYDTKRLAELQGILSRRFPDRYAPPAPPKQENKPAKPEKKRAARRAARRRKKDPGSPPTFP